MALNIVSSNICRTDYVAGLHQLLNHQADIILLQEVTLSPEALSLRFPGYQVWVSRGEGMLGIASLVKRDIECQVAALIPGRLQCLRFGPVVALNVYAPAGTNMAGDRRAMFTGELLAACRQAGCMVAGDFNSVIDQRDVEENYRNKRSVELSDLVNALGLSDTFRFLHPNVREYTFHRPGVSGARLDRIYVSEDLKAGVQQCSHEAVLSDHKAVVLSIQLDLQRQVIQKPPSHWKLNVSVLRKPEISEAIGVMADGVLAGVPEEEWPELWEEKVVPTAIFMLKQYSILQSQFRKSTKRMLQVELEMAIEAKDWDLVESTKSRLARMVEHDLHGYLIRSRESELMEGQVGSIYHARKEMKNGQAKLLTKLKVDGSVVEDPVQIKQVISKYYKSLYEGHHRTVIGTDQVSDTGESFQPDWALGPAFLDNLPVMDQAKADVVAAPITVAEVRWAIKDSKLGSSPGLDGLPYEFFKATSDWMAPVLTSLFNTYIGRGTMPLRYRKGRTVLIPKVEGIPSVDQLRPITLQACEYKILSKIFTQRLLKSMDSVVGPWQHCAIPGRRILDPLVELVSVLEYASQKNVSGFLMSTDIFKAYDRTNISFIREVMTRMGYKAVTVDLVRVLHTGCTTTIQVADGVEVEVLCLRQGDPASVPLYIMNIEPLNRRLNEIIRGFPVGLAVVRTGGFMDDISVASTDVKDVTVVNDTFQEFEQLSGTMLSRSKKTKIMGFGGWQGRTEWPVPWMQAQDSLRILGIMFSPDLDTTIRNTWSGVLGSIRSTVQRWIGDRRWTVSGKVHIIHTFILSKAWYVAQLLPPDQKVCDEVERSVSHYLFHDQVERISLSQLYTKQENGGLALVNFQAKCQALLAKTVDRGLTSQSEHLRYWLAVSLRDVLNVVGPRAEVPTRYFKQLAELYKELVEVEQPRTAKRIYQHYMTTPPPSRMEELGLDVGVGCTRLYISGDPQLVDVVFKIMSGILPTKQRLHRLNPRRWDSEMCSSCGVPGDVVHLFKDCTSTQENWRWMMGLIQALEPRVVFNPSDILNLQYPRSNSELEIGYLVLMVLNQIWKAHRQHRVLSNERLRAIIRQDILRREILQVPALSGDLLNQI